MMYRLCWKYKGQTIESTYESYEEIEDAEIYARDHAMELYESYSGSNDLPCFAEIAAEFYGIDVEELHEDWMETALIEDINDIEELYIETIQQYLSWSVEEADNVCFFEDDEYERPCCKQAIECDDCDYCGCNM